MTSDFGTARAIVDLLPASDSLLASDLARLEEIRRQRSEAAADYFRKNAENWEKLRSLHVREEDVEAAMLRLAGSSPLGAYLDLGTGTGRVLKLFAPQAQHAIGIDSSREMLAVARANLDSHRNVISRSATAIFMPCRSRMPPPTSSPFIRSYTISMSPSAR